MSASDINVGPGAAANALRTVPAEDIPTGTFLGEISCAPCAYKKTEAGAITYIATAPPGTLEATAGWQAMRITIAGGDTTIEWADGNANFDNVATDLTALSYT